MSARGLARHYAMLANGGELDGVRILSPERIAVATEIQSFEWDEVYRIRVRRALGYRRAQDCGPLAGPSAFGHVGGGGSFGYADPQRKLGHRLCEKLLHVQHRWRWTAPASRRAGRGRSRIFGVGDRVKTRAAVYVEIGKPMVIDDVQLPDPGPTQLLVKLFASGICHTQLHTLHSPDAKVPTLLGHEATAVVMGTGERVRGIREGDHVMLSFMPRHLPGGVRPELPAVNLRGQELRVSGASATWSDHVVVDQAFVVRMDPTAATDVTAVIGCAVTTGCGAVINTAKVRPGESVVVFGAGGVGLCAIQAAANVSAGPIIAVDLTRREAGVCQRFRRDAWAQRTQR